MYDEMICRRPDYRAGTEIMLADGQTWVFPAPWQPTLSSDHHLDDEYKGLLRVVCEAEDLPESRLAELALAIYLIELNYHLGSQELRSLFTFRSGSHELTRSQTAFGALAREHLLSLYPGARLSEPPSSSWPARHGLCARLRVRFRGLRSFRRWFLTSRNGEAVP